MEITIDTSQIKVLEDFFKDLSNIDQRKIFTAGFRKASKPLISSAKAGAPVGKTGNLRRSIGSTMIPSEIAVLVGSRKGSYKGWHGHLVENGTVQRFRKTKGNAPTGRVIGSHFFEEAYNQTQEQMYNSIAQEWYNEIDRFIQRVNNKK